MHWKRIIYISMFTVVLIVTAGIACTVYWGFNGNPWTKSQVANEILQYATKKYGKEMVLERTTFDMKDGSYGAYIHAKEDTSFRLGVTKSRISTTDHIFIERHQ